jgi:hypothetical protein
MNDKPTSAKLASRASGRVRLRKALPAPTTPDAHSMALLDSRANEALQQSLDRRW